MLPSPYNIVGAAVAEQLVAAVTSAQDVRVRLALGA